MEQVLTGTPVKGLQGITLGPDGGLYIGSVIGQTIVRVDTETGAMTEVIAAPVGEADDVAFGPDGAMAWTALNQGELRLRKPDGAVKTVAKGLPFVNPVTFAPDGTLYAATLFGPDRLWAYDLNANTARVVAENIGGLNAFEFGDNGALYTPLPQQQAVGKVDVKTGLLTVIAENVGNVVAVKFHPDGLLYGVSWDDGRIIRINTATGGRTAVAIIEPPIDNLAVGENGLLYITRSADNGVVIVDPRDGTSRVLTRSDLAAPGGMTWIKRKGKTVLLVTDVFGYRFVDPDSGATEILPFDLERGASADADTRDGLLALTYVRRNRVLLKNGSTGEMLQTWTDVAKPYGILIEPKGTLLVASHEDGTVIRLHPDNPQQRDILADHLMGPVGLTWATDGTSVYVAEATAGRVTRINLTTLKKDIIATGLTLPESLDTLPDDRLIIADVGAKQVVAINTETGDETVLASNLALGGLMSRTPEDIGMPTGLAVDETGVVFVVIDAENGLVKLIRD